MRLYNGIEGRWPPKAPRKGPKWQEATSCDGLPLFYDHCVMMIALESVMSSLLLEQHSLWEHSLIHAYTYRSYYLIPIHMYLNITSIRISRRRPSKGSMKVHQQKLWRKCFGPPFVVFSFVPSTTHTYTTRDSSEKEKSRSACSGSYWKIIYMVQMTLWNT